MGGSWGGVVKRCFTRGRIAERWSDAVLPQGLGANTFHDADALDELTERTRSPQRELRAWESGDRGWVLEVG